MTKFSLIKNLEKEQSAPKGSGITYQAYEVPVDGKPARVLAPIRECDDFETSLEDYDKLEEQSLKQLLRKHRGLRDNK